VAIKKKKEKYENHGTDYIIHIGSYWGSYASLGSGSGNHMIPASEKKNEKNKHSLQFEPWHLGPNR